MASPLAPLPRENTFELEGSIPGLPNPAPQHSSSSATPRSLPESLTSSRVNSGFSEEDTQEKEKKRAMKQKDPAVLVNIPKTPVALEFETASHAVSTTGSFAPKFEDNGEVETEEAGVGERVKEVLKKVL